MNDAYLVVPPSLAPLAHTALFAPTGFWRYDRRMKAAALRRNKQAKRGKRGVTPVPARSQRLWSKREPARAPCLEVYEHPAALTDTFFSGTPREATPLSVASMRAALARMREEAPDANQA